ncbi:uncharacterized protein LOC143460339 [Clavelina lepadiformis]|uniref:uncharacterized protein LOC143460339 n=1 Tax=Clavelina lepadiformis TaxID=159417 RepID=UPI004041E992
MKSSNVSSTTSHFSANVSSLNVTGHLERLKFSTKSIICLSISGFLLLLSIYLSVALARYLHKHCHYLKNSFGKSSGKRYTEKFGLALRQLCVVAAVVMLIANLFGFITQLTFPFLPGAVYCEISSKTFHALRTITEILFNSILWLRQKIFYLHPAMRHITSIVTNVISWSFFIIMLISTCSSLVIYVIGNSPSYSNISACVMADNAVKSQMPEHVILSVTITLIVVYRTLFLGLLIYPLMKHGRDLKECNMGQKHLNELLAVVRRVLVADCLCIAIFIAVAVLTDRLSQQSSFLLILIWEVELVLGFIFIMSSFIDWRKRLLPFCIRSTSRRTRRQSSKMSTRISVWSTAN